MGIESGSSGSAGRRADRRDENPGGEAERGVAVGGSGIGLAAKPAVLGPAGVVVLAGTKRAEIGTNGPEGARPDP
jgi:hypothetical protein